MIRLFTLSMLLTFAAAISVDATVYYVRTDGDNGNAGTSNSSGGAWRTIDYAADNVSAGDTVRVQAGTFEERVSPVSSGNVSNPITFVADGEVIMCGWDISGKSHIRIIGFVIDTDSGACIKRAGCIQLSGTNNFLEFWHNTMRDAGSNGIRLGRDDVINNCLVIGNVLHNFGVGNGGGVGLNIYGNDNLVAHNELYNCHPDGISIKGSRNRFLNNYTHDFSEVSGGHSDVFQSGSSSLGLSNNIIEATFQVGTGIGGDEHAFQISNSQGNVYGYGIMTENIFRRNIWHNLGSGFGINQASSGDITNTRYYHNSTIEAAETAPNNRRAFTLISPGVKNTFIYNNIEYESWGDAATTYIDVYYADGAVTIDNNLAFDPQGDVSFFSPWTTQSSSQSNADPAFKDYDNDDFTLGSGSRAIGNAGHLTNINEPFDTYGLSFEVNDAGFFSGDNPNISQYGGNLVVGDTITVGSQVRKIVAIDGNTITVDAPLSWVNNAKVYYGDKDNPDIGPYTAEHTPLLMAGISKSGNMHEVVPSGDTRWVVFYVDGIPTIVDNEAPFQASIDSETVTAVAYAQFASKIPYVKATNDGESLISPDGLRVGAGE